MRLVAPEGPVYQAGTLSGNPLATAAGLATLRTLAADPPYDELEAAAARIEATIRTAVPNGQALTVNRVGSMLTPFFGTESVSDYSGARASDVGAYARVFNRLRALGVYAPPSQFETWFVSVPLARSYIDDLCARLESAVSEL
jgi:glutamate-1-semialdehyde 2,1-aminomutase